ncbi:MAG: hypothetical protein PHS97_06070, partial [Oscillospiraceae bacterium]|nr:hypothetical protein [Oscillospiraceae bacterium]
MKTLTLSDLLTMQSKLRRTVGLRPPEADKTRVIVGMATCGMAAGAGAVMEALRAAVTQLGVADRVELVSTGCVGLCQFEPVVEVMAPGKPKITYVLMNAKKATEIAKKHLLGGKPLGKYTSKDTYTVTAISETLQRTNLGQLVPRS